MMGQIEPVAQRHIGAARGQTGETCCSDKETGSFLAKQSLVGTPIGRGLAFYL
jgi:hypothetical protein